MTNEIVDEVVEYTSEITNEMAGTGVFSDQPRILIGDDLLKAPGLSTTMVDGSDKAGVAEFSDKSFELREPTSNSSEEQRAPLKQILTNGKPAFRYERKRPAIITEWLSMAGEEVNRIRTRTDISINEFPEFLKQHHVEESIVEGFRDALSRYNWSRKFFDSQLEKLVERINSRAKDLARIHSSLGFHRMSLLLGSGKFTIAGVVQLIELEESGSIDFDKAIDVDGKSRPLREQRWEQMLSNGRLKEISTALDVIPGINREKVPGLVAKAVYDAAGLEPWRLAIEMDLPETLELPVFGIVLIDVDNFKEDTAMVLAALCSWMNVPFLLGKFQDKEFREDIELTDSVAHAVNDELFFPFRTELTDCGMWNTVLSGNYDTLRDCEFIRKDIPSEAFVPLQERFAGLLDTIEEEASNTCQIYWPLYRTAELAEKQKEEWKQLDQQLKNYLKEKKIPSC